MREILFRGKSVHQGEDWFEGSLVVTERGVYIVTGEGDAGFHLVNVLPETVGQWTGREDKEKLFADDVIAFAMNWLTKPNTQHVGKVIMDEYMWCVETTGGDIFSLNRVSKVEKLGNIHDTPSLLNDKT